MARTVPTTWEIFPQAQVDALFAAVLVHDDIHADAQLPETIPLDYSSDQLARCYAICRQLWRDGIDRPAFRALVARIARDRALDDRDRLAFRYIRANYKHMHFACMSLDRRHRYPRWMHWVTGIMGHVQDALKYGEPGEIGRFARLLRLFLSKPFSAIVDREVDSYRPTDPAAFRTHIFRQIDEIRHRLALPQLTGREFHEIRKVISRLVALHDNLKILYPSDRLEAVSRYLSTINGLMGSYHDGLVERQIKGTQDYRRDLFDLPSDMRERLETLVSRFPVE